MDQDWTAMDSGGGLVVCFVVVRECTASSSTSRLVHPAPSPTRPQLHHTQWHIGTYLAHSKRVPGCLADYKVRAKSASTERV